MSFLNPTLFLVGLACVALPIAIHILMRRRRKPVPWAAMRFLLEAYRQQRKRTRLEQLLLLASRCLLVAVLALALGRPALQGSGLFTAAGPRTLVLVIDNALTSSLASPLATERTTELDALKARAESLLGELSASRGDAAALITTGSPAAAVVSPPSADLAGVIDALRRITPTDSASDLPAALTLARQLASEPGTSIALFSPWRAGSADTAKPLPALDLPEAVRLLATPPADAPATNITLTDATPVRSILIAPEGDQTPAATQVRVNLRRSGELPAANTTVEVRAVGLSGTASPPATAPVVWAAGQSAAAVAVNLNVPLDLVRQGPSIAMVAKIVANPASSPSDNSESLAGDNIVFRPLVARRQVRVVILASRSQPTADRPDLFSPADWLTLALAPTQTALDRRSAEIEVVTIDPASASAASDILSADAVFVAAPDRLDEPMLQSLRRLLDAGRLLVLMPAPNTGIAAWTDRLSAALALPWLIAKEPRDIDPPATLAPPVSADTGLFALLSSELPELIKPVRVSRILAVQPTSQASGQPSNDRSRTLLSLADGTPLLLAATPPTDSSRGPVLFLATSPELSWTNLPAMPLMLPIMQEILRQGLGESSGATRIYAGRSASPPRDATQFRRIELAPGLANATAAEAEYAPPALAPHAGLFRTVDAAGRTLGLLAINPDPDAGKVDPVPAADLERWLAPLAAKGRFSWLDARNPAPGAQAAPKALAASDDASTPMDLWLLVAAAALGIAELILAKRFSNANASARSPGLSTTLPTASANTAPEPAA